MCGMWHGVGRYWICLTAGVMVGFVGMDGVNDAAIACTILMIRN